MESYMLRFHIWNLGKWFRGTYLQGRNRDADMKNTCMDPAREGERGMSNIETYTLAFVK